MIQYTISALLAFIVGLTLWLIKKERLLLEYQIVESELFPKDEGFGKYFVCKLKNGGNKAVENIHFKFGTKLGKIESINYSKPDMVKTESQDDLFVNGKIPLLNPTEELSLTITILDANENSNAVFEARSTGVTATKKRTDLPPTYFQVILPVVALVVAISAAFTMWTSFKQSKVTNTIESIENFEELSKGLKEGEKKLIQFSTSIEDITKKSQELQKRAEKLEKERQQGKPKREQVTFSILNRAGLSSELPDLLAVSGDGLPFWKTGLFLMHSYLINRNNASKYVDALNQIANVDFIAPSSKGFILYLAGKIERQEGNTDSAISYFEKCKAETPLMYELLMTQDPAYDLNTVREELLINKKSLLNK